MFCFRMARLIFTLSAGLALAAVLSPAQIGEGLASVAAINTSDVWAVGSSATTTGGVTVANSLAEHWDGSKWSIVATPNPQGGCAALNSVTALSSTDVWAVGSMYPLGNCGSGLKPGFIEHWDGVAWNLVSTPSPAKRGFTGVSAVNANDIWAVGYNQTSLGFYTTLTEHWNGSQWTVVSSPNMPVQQNYFNAVLAISTNNVWAAGSYLSSPTNIDEPLMEHWDGTRWSIVSAPPGSTYSFMFGISAAGANDVWAVGNGDLVLQWNGTAWSRVPMKSTNGALFGVTVFPSGEAWAVGNQLPLGGAGATLTEHWDGSSWSQVSSPSPGSVNNGLGGVAGIGSTDVWAVGSYTGASNSSFTLVEHWDGTAWSVVPSP
jgi:hypothetical protein